MSPATSWATFALIVSAPAAVSTVAAAVDNAVEAAKTIRIRLDFQLAERFIECLPLSQSVPFGLLPESTWAEVVLGDKSPYHSLADCTRDGAGFHAPPRTDQDVARCLGAAAVLPRGWS